jgi:hypothetical protein
VALVDDLIAAWELDEASGNALDSHGSSDLTDNNTVGSGTGLVYGSARDFENGSTEYFSRADNADLSVTDQDFTFEAWVQTESDPGGKWVLSKGSGANIAYGLLAFSSTWRFRVSSADGFVNDTSVDSGTAVSNGTWYHVMCGHRATANQIWIRVNAGSEVTAAYSAGTYDDTQPFYIGAFNAGTTWDGLIGPVRFWKRDASGDATELYNAGAGRTYAYITGGGGGGFVAFPRPRGLRAGMLALAGGAH